MERFMGRYNKTLAQLDCFGQSPRNDVKQKQYETFPSLRAEGEAIQKTHTIQ